MTGAPRDIIAEYATTLDYLSGDWQIYQLKDGHRFSTDDVLTAAYAIEKLNSPPDSILDLGSGIGSVAMMLAWRFSDARVLGVEAQALSVALGRRSLGVNKIEDRVRFIYDDFRNPGAIPKPGSYQLVTGSPPYLPPDAGTLSNHLQKAYCRFELRGGVEEYCHAAARAMTREGRFSLVFGARWVPRVMAAAQNAGLRILRWQLVLPRVGREPLLALYFMGHGATTTPPHQDPDLVVRDASGKRTPEMVKLRASLGMPDVPRRRAVPDYR